MRHLCRIGLEALSLTAKEVKVQHPLHWVLFEVEEESLSVPGEDLTVSHG